MGLKSPTMESLQSCLCQKLIEITNNKKWFQIKIGLSPICNIGSELPFLLNDSFYALGYKVLGQGDNSLVLIYH